MAEESCDVTGHERNEDKDNPSNLPYKKQLKH